MSKVITVSRLNSYIKTLLGNDELLSGVLVRGELSNFKHHHSGHMYFTLKDSKCTLSCVMFGSSAKRLDFRPEDGMEITAAGHVSVYEKTGRYQLYVQSMTGGGEGELYRKFEALKKKLAFEGLFDQSNKKPIPFIPYKIGVVTSATGSVIRDIQNVLYRRFPVYNLELYPSRVQGKGAEAEIASGIRYFNETSGADVIIIARGGGSIEDLWPFNEESLARTIFESRIPVVSAVGHETDFTIADFAADLRAPTPSAAAELVVPELDVLKRNIKNLSDRLINSVTGTVEKKQALLDALASRPVMKRPEEILDITEMTLDRLREKLEHCAVVILDRNESRFRTNTARLELLSPLGTLTRGYSILTDTGKHVITSIEDVDENEDIKAVLKDGSLECEVKGKVMDDAGKIL